MKTLNNKNKILKTGKRNNIAPVFLERNPIIMSVGFILLPLLLFSVMFKFFLLPHNFRQVCVYQIYNASSKIAGILSSASADLSVRWCHHLFDTDKPDRRASPESLHSLCWRLPQVPAYRQVSTLSSEQP